MDTITRHRFTRDEFERMGRAGILSEEDRVELIEGEIIAMSPIGKRHAACVRRLSNVFKLKLGSRAIVDVRNPLDLGKQSQPQPNLVLLRPRDDFYASAHPTPTDVLLLVEVAETSRDYDRDLKLPLYARSGIPEVWLVDLERNRVEIFRNPSGDAYRDVLAPAAKGLIHPAAFQDAELEVGEILA